MNYDALTRDTIAFMEEYDQLLNLEAGECACNVHELPNGTTRIRYMIHPMPYIYTGYPKRLHKTDAEPYTMKGVVTDVLAWSVAALNSGAEEGIKKVAAEVVKGILDSPLPYSLYLKAGFVLTIRDGELSFYLAGGVNE